MPAFVMVNAEAEKKPWNNFLPKPWKKGEVVKLASINEQHESQQYDDYFNYIPAKKGNSIKFRLKFAVIFRKGDDGKFSQRFVTEWANLDLLGKK